MTLFRQALILLVFIVIGLLVEGYFLGVAAVSLTVMAPFVVMAFFSIACYWWEPAYRMGVVVQLPSGLHAIVGRTGYRRLYKVVPVKHKAKMTYEKTGETFLIRESEILTPTSDVVDFGVIDSWKVP